MSQYRSYMRVEMTILQKPLLAVSGFDLTS
jgi:hypothetical protein